MTKEQFYALPCNMQQSENKISTRKKYKKPNPLAKRIICTCGRPLYWHKDKKTGEELFYCSYCRAHKENGKELKAPAASVYKKVIDAMEREHREEEKMYSAIQQGAGRKAIEAVRADSSMQMTSNLEEHLDDFGFDAQLVKSLVQRIEVSADKRIRIVFGFQDVFADLGKESAGK